MMADFKIQNLNNFSVGSIMVRCTYAIETISSHTIEANEHTLTKTIEPAETSDLTNVNMGAIRPDVRATQCRVAQYDRANPPRQF